MINKILIRLTKYKTNYNILFNDINKILIRLTKYKTNYNILFNDINKILIRLTKYKTSVLFFVFLFVLLKM